MGWLRYARCAAAFAAAPLLSSCDGAGSAAPTIGVGSPLTLTTVGLPSLDASRDGSYEAWATDAGGRTYSLGRFAPTAGEISFESPAERLRAFEITVEPPGDADDQPSSQRLLRGSFTGAGVDLSVVDAVTRGGDLREEPGTFTMFSPSDNHTGYPSHEEAGVWLFNVRPRETPQNDMWVRLTPLHAGWTYEGWMVRDLGAASEIWLSYGKFIPDVTGALSLKDDTGWGPFSGVVDFVDGSVENFPGDDWISNPLGYPFPPQLTLPLNLREKNASGQLRWTHVITIEPITDRGEAIGSERPFFMRPYRDSYGDANAGVPRHITFRPEAVPRGRVEVR